MHRVLLAGRTQQELHLYLDRTDLAALTPKTETDKARLAAIVRKAGLDRFAVVDEELEMGLRSIAVPVTSRGVIVAALNVGTAAARVTLDELDRCILPSLQATAKRLSS